MTKLLGVFGLHLFLLDCLQEVCQHEPIQNIFRNKGPAVEKGPVIGRRIEIDSCQIKECYKRHHRVAIPACWFLTGILFNLFSMHLCKS